MEALEQRGRCERRLPLAASRRVPRPTWRKLFKDLSSRSVDSNWMKGGALGSWLPLGGHPVGVGDGQCIGSQYQWLGNPYDLLWRDNFPLKRSEPSMFRN